MRDFLICCWPERGCLLHCQARQRKKCEFSQWVCHNTRVPHFAFLLPRTMPKRWQTRFQNLLDLRQLSSTCFLIVTLRGKLYWINSIEYWMRLPTTIISISIFRDTVSQCGIGCIFYQLTGFPIGCPPPASIC